MDNTETFKQDILDLIMPHLLTRAGRIYINDSEYKKAVEKADSIFEEINDRLNEELAEKLEEYFTANNAAAAIQDKLMYQQGLRDMLKLLISILKGAAYDSN